MMFFVFSFLFVFFFFKQKTAYEMRISDWSSDVCSSDLFMTGLRDDEARWCAMLAGQIKRLGGSPSGACGAFYDKVMALDEPVERLALLNRGQGWVVRKLDAMIPRVKDEVLHADLRELADSHVENIAETDQRLLEIRSGGDEAERRPQGHQSTFVGVLNWWKD